MIISIDTKVILKINFVCFYSHCNCFVVPLGIQLILVQLLCLLFYVIYLAK